MALFGLRSKLTFSMTLLAVVPLAVVTILLVWININRLETSTREYRLAVARSAVQLVLRLTDSAERDLDSIGKLIILGQKQGLSFPEVNRLIYANILSSEQIHEVALYTKDGKLLQVYESNIGAKRTNSTQGTKNQVPPSKRGAKTSTKKASPNKVRKGTPPFKKKANPIPPPKQIDAKILAQARTNELYYGDPVLKNHRAFMPVLVPILFREKKITLGYLWSKVDLSSVGEHLAFLSKSRFGKRNNIWLLDSNLRVAWHFARQRVGDRMKEWKEDLPSFRTQAGSQAGKVYDLKLRRAGEEFLVAAEPVTGVPMGIIVQQSRRIAYAGVRTTWQVALGVGLAFILVAVVLGLIFGRQLATPIIAVANAAKRVASGDFSARVQVLSKDEVGEMASSFNSMAGDLETYEERVVEETRIRTDLSRYLSVELVDDIVNKEMDLGLGGKRQQVTVMFADVVAFTPLAEGQDPERIVAILNELFTFLTEIIFRHGGIIDKFMGDCVMATFGAIAPQEDDAIRAVQAAEEMLRWLEIGNTRWEKELGARLEMGIGINSGEVVVGNIGSEKRMEYTVIGDVVNIAARLEAIARPGQILMTSKVVSLVEDEFECTSLGGYNVPGRSQSIELYALVD